MITRIIKLIFAHEVLRQYNNNRSSIFSLTTFELLAKAAWIIIILAISIAFSVEFSGRKDLQLSQITTGDSLFVKDTSSLRRDDKLSLYVRDKESNKASEQLYVSRTDLTKSNFYIGIAVEVDSLFEYKEKEAFVHVKFDKSLTINHVEYYNSNNYKKGCWLKLEDVRLGFSNPNYQNPETNGFLYFCLLIASIYSIYRFISSCLKYFKKKKAIYGNRNVYKSDKRFSTGRKAIGTEIAIIGHEPLNEEEIKFNKEQQRIRMITFGIVALAGILIIRLIS